MIKRGAVAGEIGWQINAPGPTPLQDGAGGAMAISLTPPRDGWWIIRAETIWRIAEANWYWWYWSVALNRADVNGWSQDYAHMTAYNGCSWTESCIDTAFRVAAGIPYTAYAYWPNASNGGTQVYYTGPEFHSLQGEFCADGRV